MRIDEAFPYKVCINLDRRPERWQRVQERFAAHGITGVQRFAAIDGNAVELPPHWRHTAGAYGCLRSHLAVVEEARRLGMPSVLIFEDDVVFDGELEAKFSERYELLVASCPGLAGPAEKAGQRATRNAQLNWDLLYFGALHKADPIPVTEHVARLTRSNSTYAYALRETVYDAFIELNRRAEDVLDNNSFLLQQQFNCLCFLPHLAWVENDWSDAQTKVEAHWYLQESLVLFGAGADRLLGETTVVLAHPGGDAANLLYLVRHYRELFTPELELVIVEQGLHPTIDAAALPANCRYVLLRDEGPFDRERCFAEGMRLAGERRFVVLSDGDIYLETLDFRANLRMCERYASATGFSGIVELSAAESLRLRTTNTTRGLTPAAPVRTGGGAAGQCRFVNRSLQATPPFRVFHSPNHALRLR
ncbi:MAG TPA: glycosyltransferase family 25 protein [Thermoanaerobaculia bacterium]